MVYGTTGIGLFACALAGLTDRPEIKAAALSCTEIALDDLRFHFHALKTGALVPAEPDTGKATGFGGYLRCLALMNRLQPGLCTDLIDEGLRLPDSFDLDTVTRADRLLGISGLVSTLVRFPELLESASGKTVLRRAAERLMALRGFQEGSFTLWRTVSPHHLISGAGHGMAGIAEALYGAGRNSGKPGILPSFSALRGSATSCFATRRRSGFSPYCNPTQPEAVTSNLS